MQSDYFTKFLNDLAQALKKLSHSHQLAFAASCCERAYPNYEIFSEKEAWGDAAALRSAIDAVWQFIVIGEAAQKNWGVLLSKCKNATPDSDFFHPKTDLESVLIAAGQEAAFMMTLLLQFCEENQLSYVLRIVTFARDTIDMYVQDIEKLDPMDPLLNEKIGQHPLMLEELRKQENDVEKLTQIKTRADLSQFREYATHPERSNIGLVSTKTGK